MTIIHQEPSATAEAKDGVFVPFHHPQWCANGPDRNIDGQERPEDDTHSGEKFFVDVQGQDSAWICVQLVQRYERQVALRDDEVVRGPLVLDYEPGIELTIHNREGYGEAAALMEIPAARHLVTALTNALQPLTEGRAS